jgi:hypothetical protein
VDEINIPAEDWSNVYYDEDGVAHAYEEPANDGLFAQIAHEYDERDRLTALLETLPDKYRKHGYTMCESECEYDRVKYLKSLEMEEQGFKVTFIKENVDGYEDVGMAELKARMARVDYEADKEEINAVKLRLRQLSDQMNRDYGRPSNNM